MLVPESSLDDYDFSPFETDFSSWDFDEPSFLFLSYDEPVIFNPNPSQESVTSKSGSDTSNPNYTPCSGSDEPNLKKFKNSSSNSDDPIIFNPSPFQEPVTSKSGSDTSNPNFTLYFGLDEPNQKKFKNTSSSSDELVIFNPNPSQEPETSKSGSDTSNPTFTPYFGSNEPNRKKSKNSSSSSDELIIFNPNPFQEPVIYKSGSDTSTPNFTPYSGSLNQKKSKNSSSDLDEPVFNPNPSNEPVTSKSDSDTSNPSFTPYSGSDELNRKKSKNSSSGNSDEITSCVIDERKRKRMISNRESARRLRMRKHRHLENLRDQLDRFKIENRELMNRFCFLVHQDRSTREENELLKVEAIVLRQRLWDICQGLLVHQLHNLNISACSCNNFTYFNEG